MNQEEKAWEYGKSCFWRSLFWPSLVSQHGGQGSPPQVLPIPVPGRDVFLPAQPILSGACTNGTYSEVRLIVSHD